MDALRRNGGGILLTGLLLAALGIHCALFEGGGPLTLDFPPDPPAPEPSLRFSHRLHAEAEMGCPECHGEGAQVALPSERGDGHNCVDCHEDEVGKRNEPGDGCTLCHTRPDFEVPWPQSPRLAGLVFDHGLHGKTPCLACHPGLDAREGPARGTPGRMETCTACHDREKALGCAGCHGNLDVLEPRSHGARNWLPAHGAFSEGPDIPGGRNDCAGCHGGNACNDCHGERRPESHAGPWAGFPHGLDARIDPDRCAVCHTRASCDACHAVTPPRDHVEHWRQVGHGVAVSADRDRCRTCHTVDFCVACHAEASPRSHTLQGGWNNPQNNHCVACHWPPGSGGTNCTVCHKTFPGHAAQAPLSAAHAARSPVCSTCHQGMHPVNDNACTDCHR